MSTKQLSPEEIEAGPVTGPIVPRTEGRWVGRLIALHAPGTEGNSHVASLVITTPEGECLVSMFVKAEHTSNWTRHDTLGIQGVLEPDLIGQEQRYTKPRPGFPSIPQYTLRGSHIWLDAGTSKPIEMDLAEARKLFGLPPA